MDAATGTSAQHVRDVMTTRVHTVGMDDSVLTLKGVFDRERFHHAVVVEQGQVVGVVSDRDILKTISPFVGRLTEQSKDVATLHKRVHQIMTRKPVTIGPDETIAVAAEKMLAARVSCLPVLGEKGSLLGILTFRDIVVRAAGGDLGERILAPAPPPKQAHDAGVLIVIDGRVCYHPGVSLGRAIREAHNAGITAHDRESNRAESLPTLTVQREKLA